MKAWTVGKIKRVGSVIDITEDMDLAVSLLGRINLGILACSSSTIEFGNTDLGGVI